MSTETILSSPDMKQVVEQIIERHYYDDSALIEILQDVQKELNWLGQVRFFL